MRAPCNYAEEMSGCFCCGCGSPRAEFAVVALICLREPGPRSVFSKFLLNG